MFNTTHSLYVDTPNTQGAQYSIYKTHTYCSLVECAAESEVTMPNFATSSGGLRVAALLLEATNSGWEAPKGEPLSNFISHNACKFIQGGELFKIFQVDKS